MDQRLKELRKRLNLTQQAFADRIKVSRNNVAGYETATRSPSEAVISLICSTFHVNEEWLKEGTGEMFTEVSEEDLLFEWVGKILKDRPNSFKRRFLNMLRSFDDSDWDALEKKCLMLFDLKQEKD